jgi:hypothetical protein
MSYLVKSIDGDFDIQRYAVDSTSTSLVLPGKDVTDWGEPYSNNFVKLLQNSAGPDQPANGRTGQLWLDTSTGLFKTYANGAWTGLSVSRLSTPRTISLSGAASGSVSFDGTADVAIPVTLSNTGVIAGVYQSANITVGADGRITAAGSGLTGNDITTPVYSITFQGGRGPLIANVVVVAQDITDLLGYTPYNGTANPLGFINNAAGINNALGYVPVNPAVLAGYVAKSGDTMGGQLLLQAPNQPSSAARKQDVDAKTTRVFQGGISSIYNVTVSPNAPSGGVDGDVWYRY